MNSAVSRAACASGSSKTRLVVGRAATARARRRRRTPRRSRGRSARRAPRPAAPACARSGRPEPGWRSGAGAPSHSTTAITTSSTAYSTGTKRQPPGTTPPTVVPRGDQRDERRSDQLGHRRADVAGAEHAQREALALARRPGRVPGDADRERVAREAEEEARTPSARRRSSRATTSSAARRSPAAAASSGAARRPGRSGCRAAAARSIREDGDRAQPGELHGVELQLLADRHAQHAQHQPDGEQQGEGDCRTV